MGRTVRVLIGGVIAVAVVLAGIGIYLRPIAPVATGYAAKVACSAVFISGRSLDDAMGDLPDNPLVPLLRLSHDDAEATVRASLLGLWSSTGHHTTGTGCTLAASPPGFDPLPQPPAGDPTLPWPTGDAPPGPLPADVDADALAAAVATAFTEDDPQGRQRNTRAVVVIRDGQLLTERYGGGFDADTPLLGWSMAKSVAAALTGVAVQRDLLAVTETDLRPEWRADDRSEISVQHLLTMTSGLAFEEVYDPGTDATRMLFTPRGAATYAAGLDLVHAPGTVWSYSSGSTNILCDLLHERTGLGPELGRQLLFEPLGMSSAVLEPDLEGRSVCSSFLYATARDWARFGQFHLDDGVWEGRRLLPEGWVDAVVTPVPQATDTPYGSQWWLNEGPAGQLRMPGVPADAYWASGNEGQQVVVIPSEGLVVVRLGFSGSFSGVEWGLEPLLTGIIAATG